MTVNNDNLLQISADQQVAWHRVCLWKLNTHLRLYFVQMIHALFRIWYAPLDLFLYILNAKTRSIIPKWLSLENSFWYEFSGGLLRQLNWAFCKSFTANDLVRESYLIVFFLFARINKLTHRMMYHFEENKRAFTCFFLYETNRLWTCKQIL